MTMAVALAMFGGQARAQSGPADPGVGAYILMENGAAATISEEPIGSLDLSGDQRLSVRSYQYRDFSGGNARQSSRALGYYPHRDGDLDPARMSGIDDLSKAWDYGGIVEYGYSDPDDPRSSAGINIRIAPGDGGASEGWFLQPGASYSRPVAERWQFNARVYSTIASPNAAGTTLQAEAQAPGGLGWMNGDSTFQDVGVNLGLAYDVNENWRLGTGAGVSRTLGKPGEAAVADDEASSTNFFGGVVLKYKF
jgi:hypothetical protein